MPRCLVHPAVSRDRTRASCALRYRAPALMTYAIA